MHTPMTHLPLLCAAPSPAVAWLSSRLYLLCLNRPFCVSYRVLLSANTAFPLRKHKMSLCMSRPSLTPICSVERESASHRPLSCLFPATPFPFEPHLFNTASLLSHSLPWFSASVTGRPAPHRPPTATAICCPWPYRNLSCPPYHHRRSSRVCPPRKTP